MWNKRYIPYPLLASWTDDYVDGNSFSVSIPHSTRDNRDNLNLTIVYELSSNFLKELIDSGQAKFLSIIECNQTFKRISFSPSRSESEDIIVEPFCDFSDSLLLTPYIVSTCILDGFLSDEHVDEIRNLNPRGFQVAAWSMLARGNEHQINLAENSNPNSVIDLVGSQRVEDGEFSIDLNENRIKIYVSHNDYQLIEIFRNNKMAIEPERASLVPSLYMYAVVDALRNLLENEDKVWHATMRYALVENKIEVDDEELRENALRYAQILMANPLGKMLSSFDHGGE